MHTSYVSYVRDGFGEVIRETSPDAGVTTYVRGLVTQMAVALWSIMPMTIRVLATNAHAKPNRISIQSPVEFSEPLVLQQGAETIRTTYTQRMAQNVANMQPTST